jgi:dihydropteroate synthase
VLHLPSGTLPLERVAVVGILNVTPDSFYDGGRYMTQGRALARAREMVLEGADALEIGGEKAGPGPPVSAEEEIERILPVLEAIHGEIDVPISVDTWKPAVARAAVAAGASIINSIDGFADPALRAVAAETGAAVVVMHIRGRPRVPNPDPQYRDVVAEVRASLIERVDFCIAAGVRPDRVVIDPGPGFGKTAEDDLSLIRRIVSFTELPYPVMLAASRKSFIGAVLNGGPDDRLEGTMAVLAWGVLRGVKLVRVHDVRAAVRVVRMTEAVLHPECVEPKA